LLIEDYDTQLVPPELAAPDPTAGAKFAKMKDALLELMSRRGLAHTYARELHHRLRERGLMQVENHGAIAVFAVWKSWSRSPAGKLSAGTRRRD
jgi:hypothetical protein